MRHVKILLAAAMTVGGMSVLPAQADTAKTAAPTTLPSQSHATLTSGVGTAQLAAGQTKAPVRKVIAELTTAALTPRGMDKLVALFPDARQKQIEQSKSFSQNYGDPLDSQIKAICKTWNEKYGHELASFKGADAIGSDFFPITMHNAGNPAQLSAAIVTVNGPKNRTGFEAKFLCESGSHWKIDVPASMTAQTLRDNLTSQLTAFEKQSGQWPSEQYDAYRLLTRHVMMAVLDHQPALPKQTDARLRSNPPRSARHKAQTSPGHRLPPIIGGSSGPGRPRRSDMKSNRIVPVAARRFLFSRAADSAETE